MLFKKIIIVIIIFGTLRYFLYVCSRGLTIKDKKGQLNMKIPLPTVSFFLNANERSFIVRKENPLPPSENSRVPTISLFIIYYYYCF